MRSTRGNTRRRAASWWGCALRWGTAGCGNRLHQLPDSIHIQRAGRQTGEQKPGQPPPTGTPPADEQGDVPPEETEEQTPTDVPKEEAPDKPEEGESEEGTAKEKTGNLEVSTGVEGGKEGGMGKGTEPGSKYGWLGLIHPSKEVIKALETIFEALGDTEEFAALTELLNHLKEFEKVGREMRSWFDDPDKFLRVD